MMMAPSLIIVLVLPCFLLSLVLFSMCQVLATASHQGPIVPGSSGGDTDERRGGLVNVNLRFETRTELPAWDFQCKVIAEEMDDVGAEKATTTTIPSSLTNNKDSQDDTTDIVLLFEFSLKQERSYILVLACFEGADDSHRHKNPLPVLAKITITTFDNRVLLFEENFRLDSRLHAIHIKTTALSKDAKDSRRGLQETTYPPKVYLGEITRAPTEPVLRPLTTEKPTPAPRTTPKPTPRPVSLPTRSPTAISPTPPPTSRQTPSPSQGNTPAPQTGGGGGGAGGGGTATPTAYTAVKPTTVSSASNTSAPSTSPTIEPPCISTTSGSLPFDNKYIAVQLRVTDIQAVNLTQNDTDRILADIVDAYNAVSICDQEGAFRRIDQAYLVRVNQDPSSGSYLEWIVRLTGECDGCIDSVQSLFNDDSVNQTTTLDTTDLPWLNTTNNGTLVTAKPCFCPGPLTTTFQDHLNTILQANSTEQVMIFTVVELENEESCDTSILQEDLAPPQEHSTLVTFVVTNDPSDMAEADLQSMFDRFIDVVHSHLALTYPTCDLSRKRIIDIQQDPNNPTIGRKLQHGNPSMGSKLRRKIQETSADFELVANVTFSCFGCEGQLFGKTNFTPNYDCLCPRGGDRYGVNEKDILFALNDVMNQRTVSLSTTDIIEIEQVPCSSTISNFSTVVVIEYVLKSNETTPSPDDLAILEDNFVAGYNGMARRYCDPYFRRITSAKTFPNYGISVDGLRLNVEMSVIGTCRGNCTNDIPIYDPNAFFESMETIFIGNVTTSTAGSMQVNRHRVLQTEADSTCYCNRAASRELGPSEPEIVQNFGDLVDQLSLESILEVAECRPTTFVGGFQISLPTNGTFLTQAELYQIGQSVMDSYNNQTQQSGFCDQYFRKIVHVDVQKSTKSDRSFTARALDGEQMPMGRVLLTRTRFRPKRRVQAQQDQWPSTAPSSSPSIELRNNTQAPYLAQPISSATSSSVFIEVTGLCQGCSIGIDFFDQVSTRRRLQGSDSDSEEDLNNTSTNRCFCEPNSKRVNISSTPVIKAISSLSFVNGTVDLEEVEIVECSVEVNTFETSMPLDFLVNGDIAQEDEVFIANGFMTTYTQLSEEYCDSLFRQAQVVSTDSLVLWGPDQNGISKVRFLLGMQGTCRGCTGSEPLFDANRRRMQEEEEVCYCKKNAIPRAPTDDEFQQEFSKYLGSGRRLQQGNKFTLLCVGSICDPIVPTFSPTSVTLINPNGAQNFAGCDVPDPSFIGDGYCDRSVDNNDLPVLNNAECGYDGGDCCESTCQSFTYECGSGQYWCLDPNAQVATNNAVNNPCTVQAGTVLGDGLCDSELNIPFCSYDSGDCCESTCGVLNGLTCVGPFPSCVDPTASENAPSSSPSVAPSLSQKPSQTPSKVPSSSPSRIPSSTPSKSPSRVPSTSPSKAPSSAPSTVLTGICTSKCSPSEFCGDGFCDEDLNNELCGWDGGDCCQGSCVSTIFPCPTSASNYTCRDPKYSGVPASCNVTYLEFVGDGFCDVFGGYNNELCDFDGGDCCEDSCVPNKYPCEFFACTRGLGLPLSCEVMEPWYIGDGYCDFVEPYNTPKCNWDNGDCCPDTCVSKYYTCGFDSAYFCLNLTSPFYENLTLPPEKPAGCNVSYAAYLGDGACYGSEYNTAECLWDFGDCCAETCTANESQWHHPYLCGSYGYNCLDPAIPKKPAVPSNCSVPYTSWLGDGWCSGGVYNTAECLWEFGDCCNRTCNKADWYQPYQCGIVDYDCKDPAEPKPPAVPSSCNVTYKKWLGDGWCSGGAYNTAECGWEFGDCCEQTCKNATWYQRYQCGAAGYSCKDPAVPKPPLKPANCYVSSPSRLGDGSCDYGSYNTPECLYDFGDCCEQSCKEARWDQKYDCGSGGYECFNASVRPIIPQSCNVTEPSYIGDGYCNGGEYNTEACEWDKGDCCIGTCGLVKWYHDWTCGYDAPYNCLDPSQTQGTQRPAVPADCAVSPIDWLGDGYCEGGEYNTAECLWEFGDCCNKTCNEVEWAHPYKCGLNFYRCLDPSVPKPPPVPSGCVVTHPEYLGDGGCDNYANYNTAACGYDLGDCCFKTCNETHPAGYHQYECGSFGYSCKDPTVPKPPPRPSGCNVDYPSSLGDGACDWYGGYNTAACNWDFGDCCYQNCTTTNWYQPYECGSFGYNCLDPKGGAPSSIKLVGFYTGVVDYDWYLSGTYRAQSDFLFGQPVYYRYIGSMMVHWCQEGHWTIQIITNVTLIASKGCKGQGFRSLPQSSPDLCSAVWKDDSNNTAVMICAVNCPQPCPPLSLMNAAQALLPTPTALPSFSPSLHPSMLPSVFPSVFPSLSPSKLPSMIPSRLPSVGPSMLPSAVPAILPSAVPSRVPSPAPSKLPTPLPSSLPSTSHSPTVVKP